MEDIRDTLIAGAIAWAFVMGGFCIFLLIARYFPKFSTWLINHAFPTIGGFIIVLCIIYFFLNPLGVISHMFDYYR